MTPEDRAAFVEAFQERWGFAPTDDRIARPFAAYHIKVAISCAANKIDEEIHDPMLQWLHSVQRKAEELLLLLDWTSLHREHGEALLQTFAGGLAYGPLVKDGDPKPPGVPDHFAYAAGVLGHVFLRVLQDLARDPAEGSRFYAFSALERRGDLPPIFDRQTGGHVVTAEAPLTKDEIELIAFDALCVGVCDVLKALPKKGTKGFYQDFLDLASFYSIPVDRIHTGNVEDRISWVKQRTSRGRKAGREKINQRMRIAVESWGDAVE